MAMTNAAAQNFLNLLFLNTDWANVGDAAGLQNSAGVGDIFISLHTADPGTGGNQGTSECAYTGYARIAVARSGAGWALAAQTMDNAAAITFGEKTAGGDETATYFGFGSDASGVGNLYGSGALTAGLLISNGIVPEFAIGDCNWTAG